MICEYTEEPAVVGRQASLYDEADSTSSSSIDSLQNYVGLVSMAMDAFFTPSGKLQQWNLWYKAIA